MAKREQKCNFPYFRHRNKYKHNHCRNAFSRLIKEVNKIDFPSRMLYLTINVSYYCLFNFYGPYCLLYVPSYPISAAVLTAATFLVSLFCPAVLLSPSFYCFLAYLRRDVTLADVTSFTDSCKLL